MVPFESALERDCITFLAGHDGFCRIESQPISITFVYGRRERRYTPDFFVIFYQLPDALAHIGFGIETYVEVKYADLAALFDPRQTAISSPMWDYALSLCSAAGTGIQR